MAVMLSQYLNLIPHSMHRINPTTVGILNKESSFEYYSYQPPKKQILSVCLCHKNLDFLPLHGFQVTRRKDDDQVVGILYGSHSLSARRARMTKLRGSKGGVAAAEF